MTLPRSYFYPRSPCGERRGSVVGSWPRKIFLSTLSLRRATSRASAFTNFCLISIHALLAESDGGSVVGSWPRKIFLSTLSLRRATLAPKQNPTEQRISIHALLAESDRPLRQFQFALHHFYPRSPCGERQLNSSCISSIKKNFYPRSPCGERQQNRHRRKRKDDFYPRSPCGERRGAR